MSDKCPKCGSVNTYVDSNSKIEFAKGVLVDVGAALLAGMLGQGSAAGNFLGTRAGAASSNVKRECHCRNCGHKWYK